MPNITPNPNAINPGKPTNNISPSQGRCPQCGMFHPPLAPGQICPMATYESKDSNEPKVDFTKFITNLKTILISQFEKKDIKDKNKLLQEVTIKIVKFIEEYGEKNE